MIEKCGPNEYKIRLKGISPITFAEFKKFMENDPKWHDVMSGRRKPYNPLNLCVNPSGIFPIAEGECGCFKNITFENNHPYIVIESHGNREGFLRMAAKEKDGYICALPYMEVEHTDHGFVMTKLKRFDLFIVPYL